MDPRLPKSERMGGVGEETVNLASFRPARLHRVFVRYVASVRGRSSSGGTGVWSHATVMPRYGLRLNG